MKKQFKSFKDARAFVHALKLKNQREWIQYTKSGKKPDDIPTAPWTSYKEWIGLSDWLGTKNIAGNLMKFKSFSVARKFVQKLKFKNQKEWRNYCTSGEKPSDIPSNPGGTYKKEWVSYGDWLGTGTIADRNLIFREFEPARKFTHSLNLKNQKQWQEYAKSGNKPDDLPSTPSRHYKEQWNGWGDWLGTGTLSNLNREFLSFDDAKIFAHSLNLKNQRQWKEYCKSGKKPSDISTSPHKTYKNKGWTTWGDWLGTGTVQPQKIQYRSFEKAREFIRKLKLKNHKEWEEYCKSGEKPDDIPAAPWSIYKELKNKNLN